MPRKRDISPGFFKNEVLGSLHPLARIAFEGLWCWADRNGRLEDRPMRLKAEILPFDNFDFGGALDELEAKGFIKRYRVDDKALILITKFAVHQKPHPHEPAIHPAPTAAETAEAEKTYGESLQSNVEPCQKDLLLLHSYTPLLLPSSPNGEDHMSSGSKPKPSPEAFVVAWNSASDQFVKCRGLSGTRLRAFKARVALPDWVMDWKPALERAALSTFCKGANDRGWKANVDWFLRPDTVTRILEGLYDDRGPAQASTPTETPEQIRERIRRQREENLNKSGKGAN